jgi:hypothetical protein
MRVSTLKKGKRFLARGVAMVLSAALALPLGSVPAMAAPGGVTDNSGLIPFQQAYFAFEVEGPIGTLKDVPIWDEIEQMLDNPYLFALDPVRGNDQGWPSYRRTDVRRRSFVYRLNGDTSAAGVPCAPGTANCVEVLLPRYLVHPLNYNQSTGEELRLLNPQFEETEWESPSELLLIEEANTDETRGPLGVPVYEYTSAPITISAGADRMEDDEASPNFNSPMAPDTYVCIVTVDQFFSPGPGPVGSTVVPEGSIVCGADPGEPGYLGFGVLGDAGEIVTQYSTPAFPMPDGSDPATDITSVAGFGTGTARLFDPAGCA